MKKHTYIVTKTSDNTNFFPVPMPTAYISILSAQMGVFDDIGLDCTKAEDRAKVSWDETEAKSSLGATIVTATRYNDETFVIYRIGVE